MCAVDGTKGDEANALIKQLARHLAKRWRIEYSVAAGYINTRMSIAIVRATSRCIRGSRVPLKKTSKRYQWEDGAGLGLHR